MSQATWEFDIPIHQWDDQYSIPELIRMGNKAFSAVDYDTAHRFYSRAEASVSGKRKLAKLYIDVPGILTMAQTERFKAAETLLLQAAASSKEACLDLAALYLDKLNRPVAALSYLLQAKNRGAEIHPAVIERCKNIIHKSDIRTVEAYSRDCYQLALAMQQCGLDEGKRIEYLLQVATDAGEDYSAITALWLAEFYEEQKNRSLADKYCRIATTLGNPPVLR